MTFGTPDDALTLLNSIPNFEWGSEGLRIQLSQMMQYQQVDDGHILVNEKEEIKEFYFLEEGALARYKDDLLVDVLDKRGQVTGFMHAFSSASTPAFATIKAQGTTKVWICKGDDVRQMLLANPTYSIEFIQRMGFLIRKETKISRALQKATSTATSADEMNEAAKGNCLRVLCYDATSWVKNGFIPAIEDFNKTLAESTEGVDKICMEFTEERLTQQSAAYATGYRAICTFVNDTADQETIATLRMLGVKMIAQRAAGFDRIDTTAAKAYGMTVARVPAYSPYAVAEFAITLLMTVNRKIAKANNRVKMANFSLDEGLMGMDIYGKTVAVMGTGKIGAILCRIISGFGANLICYDVFENEEVKELGGKYVSKDEVYSQADVIFLMMPLLPPTKHTINMDMLPKLKKGVILINTSRGGLIDTKALLQGLRSKTIAGVGMDVYENEADYFFQDWSSREIPDPDLTALLGDHNVVLTAHQAFFTHEAVNKIVSTTLENLREFGNGKTGFDHPNNCIPVPKK